MTDKIVEILIQGGAAGLALALLWYSYKKDKMYNKSINNHLEHDELAKKEVAGSNIELAKAITKLADRVSKCPFKK